MQTDFEILLVSCLSPWAALCLFWNLSWIFAYGWRDYLEIYKDLPREPMYYIFIAYNVSGIASLAYIIYVTCKLIL